MTKNMENDVIENEILKKLADKKKTLALAESCTGGLVSSRITDIPGSSKCFLGGVVSYSNDIKHSMLGVNAGIIQKHGAVSREVARSMAEGVKRLTGADITLAITGIAGPSGGSAEKPVGLAYIACVSGEKVRTKRVMFDGSRTDIKNKFSRAALEIILDNI